MGFKKLGKASLGRLSLRRRSKAEEPSGTGTGTGDRKCYEFTVTSHPKEYAGDAAANESEGAQTKEGRPEPLRMAFSMPPTPEPTFAFDAPLPRTKSSPSLAARRRGRASPGDDVGGGTPPPPPSREEFAASAGRSKPFVALRGEGARSTCETAATETQDSSCADSAGEGADAAWVWIVDVCWGSRYCERKDDPTCQTSVDGDGSSGSSRPSLSMLDRVLEVPAATDDISDVTSAPSIDDDGSDSMESASS